MAPDNFPISQVPNIFPVLEYPWRLSLGILQPVVTMPDAPTFAQRTQRRWALPTTHLGENPSDIVANYRRLSKTGVKC